MIGMSFSYLIDKCYALTGDFGAAIIIFTFLTRAILFPVSLLSQKNSIKLFKLQPQLEDIKARYNGEPDTMLKEQKALYNREKYSAFKATLPLLVQIPIIIGVVRAVNRAVGNSKYDFIFAGLDLSAIPTFASSLVIIPILSAASAFLMCSVQNELNPLSKAQGFWGKWGTAIFLTAFSGYFAFVCQAAVGLYWIFGNLSGSLVAVICTLIYNPKKYIDYTNYVVRRKPSKEERQAAKELKKAKKSREKEDVKRFFSCEKQLVFYSESSGFYKYFEHFVNYILANSEIIVHYVTSDIADQVFEINHPRFKAYFCGYNGLIPLMMKMDADIVVMSMPDLEQYHIKRSLVKKDVEYIYVDHGMGSFNLTLRKGALDHFDTIFCYGKNHNEEIRAMERVYRLPEKRLVNVGFGLLDMLIEQYRSMENAGSAKQCILIAPSWQKDNIFECCLDELLAGLLTGDYKIIIRPHPEFVKRFPSKMKRIFDKYGDKTGADFEIQMDFSSNSTVYLSDLVITDWSSIAQEFSFTTKKPSLHINTPMKVTNPEWQRIGVEPMELWVRGKIGISVEIDRLGDIGKIARELLEKQDVYGEQIQKLVCQHMYNVGNAAEVGAGYIIGRLSRLEEEHGDNGKY